MWQAPNQRVRAIQSAKKRQLDRLKRPIHLKRVRAEVKSIGPDKRAMISEARVILNDMNAQGMGIFSPQPILVGQEITITMDDPKQIFLKGRVTWCQEYDVDSHVLSLNAFSYRMGIKFHFASDKEEEAVKQFCDELIRGVLYNSAA